MCRYPVQLNKRRRTILRPIATLPKTAHEINVILRAGPWEPDGQVFRASALPLILLSPRRFAESIPFLT
jgi:hypothetical protein